MKPPFSNGHVLKVKKGRGFKMTATAIKHKAETSRNASLTREADNLSEIVYNNGLGSNLSDDNFE